jgi:LEA14-like dessication related protein
MAVIDDRKEGEMPKWLFSVLVVCALAGCDTVRTRAEKLSPPRVNVRAIALKDMNPLSPTFRVRLELENPNDENIRLDGADAVLALNGQNVAKGVSRSPLDLPKRGKTEVEVDVQATTLKVLKHLGRAARQEVTPYTVTGNLHVLEALGKLGAIPFRIQGEVKSEDLLKLGIPGKR